MLELKSDSQTLHCNTYVHTHPHYIHSANTPTDKPPTATYVPPMHPTSLTSIPHLTMPHTQTAPYVHLFSDRLLPVAIFSCTDWSLCSLLLCHIDCYPMLPLSHTDCSPCCLLSHVDCSSCRPLSHKDWSPWSPSFTQPTPPFPHTAILLLIIPPSPQYKDCFLLFSTPSLPSPHTTVEGMFSLLFLSDRVTSSEPLHCSFYHFPSLLFLVTTILPKVLQLFWLHFCSALHKSTAKKAQFSCNLCKTT